MSPLVISFISFSCIFGGTLVGFYIGTKLPEPHLSNDSKDTIKMAWGIIATMSALILSLLVASAKNSFDTINNESTLSGAKIIVLDDILVRYGPEAQAVRDDLRRAVESAIESDWPDESLVPLPPGTGDEKLNGIEAVQDELTKLIPANESQSALLAQARQTSGDLLEDRWLVMQQSRTLLPPVLLIALVFWLTMLFTGIGLFAPHNRTVLATLLLCSLCVSISIFLINDLSHPLRGMIKVPSDPMLDALRHLDRT